jgi:hypothetical protein
VRRYWKSTLRERTVKCGSHVRQLDDRLFLTDGGIEIVLIFHEVKGARIGIALRWLWGAKTPFTPRGVIPICRRNRVLTPPHG